MVLSGRYETDMILGSGGIGAVHRARDRVLDEVVALKVIHPHLRSEPAVLDAFRREVAISRMVDHPAVARIFDMGTDPDTDDVYLAMEYLPGGDLKRRILSGGALDAHAVVELARAMLGALAAAHARGVVHRDVKPHNVLFDSAGRPLLADFGLARCGALAGLQEAHRVVGTPEYLAPEAVESVWADARSDLYSLGVVLFEAATGRLPFTGSTVYEILRHQAQASPPPLPQDCRGYDPGLAVVVERLLAKDPSRRYQTANDAAGALDRSGTRETPPPAPVHPCPVCGSPVPDDFPHCFACGRDPLYLAPSRRREPRYRVLVTGPGKPGDQIRHELRARCLELVGDAGVQTRRLRSHLPRVPFVLMRGMEVSGAGELVEALGRAGVQARAVPEGVGALPRETRSLVRRKDALMAGRVVGVLMATIGGTYGSVSGWIGQRGGFAGILATLAAVLVIGPLITVIRHRLPEVRWKPGGWGERARVLSRYLELAPHLKTPALQALARRIVLRYRELDRLGVEREIVSQSEGLVLKAADWLEACQALEDRLAEADERGLYRRIADLRSGLEAAAPETIAQAERSLDQRRDRERRRGVLLDRILSFSARLDSLLTTLGARGTHLARADSSELERAAVEAADAVKAIRELDMGSAS